MRSYLLIAVLGIFFSTVANATDGAAPDSFISFRDAEEIAVQNSHRIASQRFMVDSARQDAAAQKVKRYPSLRFGAESKFVSKIGEITIPQAGITNKVGDHISWSTGPAVDWVVWDTGQITDKAKSLGKMADSEENQLDYTSRQVLLNVRLAYVDVQLANEEVRLVRDALKLSRAQYSDVSQKKSVGTADLLDQTVAHQEVVDRERDLENALGQLAVTKRTLLAALGFDPRERDPDAIRVEPIGGVLSMLLPRSNVAVDVEAHPQVKALADQSEAASLAARSSGARHWPKVVMGGSSTFQYPNFGKNEIIQQNQATLGLNLPILDWGMISKETRSYKFQAHSADEQKKETAIDLSRRLSQIRERISTLKGLRSADAKAVKDAVAVARLTYDSFQAGRLIFLDVQRANVKALSVKVEAARNDAELAMQISRLLALAADAESPEGEPR